MSKKDIIIAKDRENITQQTFGMSQKSIANDIKERLSDIYIGDHVVLVEEEDIRNFFQNHYQTGEKDSGMILLDGGVYSSLLTQKEKLEIAISRTFPTLNDVKKNNYGYQPRDGGDVDSYLTDILNQLHNHSKIVIVDDGIFSGTTLQKIIDGLAKKGMRPNITVLTYFDFSSGKIQHIDIISKYKKDMAEIRDWLDERDLYIGLTMSGASVQESGRIVGYPYRIDKEIAIKKASVPESKVGDFIESMVDMNKLYFDALNKILGTKILLEHLPRFPGALKNKFNVLGNNPDIVCFLKEYIQELRKNNYVLDL